LAIPESRSRGILSLFVLVFAHFDFFSVEVHPNPRQSPADGMLFDENPSGVVPVRSASSTGLPASGPYSRHGTAFNHTHTPSLRTGRSFGSSDNSPSPSSSSMELFEGRYPPFDMGNGSRQGSANGQSHSYGAHYSTRPIWSQPSPSSNTATPDQVVSIGQMVALDAANMHILNSFNEV
jgi:hypothetical protein